MGHCISVVFSTDGDLLASGYLSGELDIFSKKTQQHIPISFSHGESMTCIATSPATENLVLGFSAGLLSLVNPELIASKCSLHLPPNLTDADGHAVTLRSSGTEESPFLISSMPLMENSELPADINMLRLTFSEPIKLTSPPNSFSSRDFFLEAESRKFATSKTTAVIREATTLTFQNNTLSMSFQDSLIHLGTETNEHPWVRGMFVLGKHHVTSTCYSDDALSIFIADAGGSIKQINGFTEAPHVKIASNVRTFARMLGGNAIVYRDGTSEAVTLPPTVDRLVADPILSIDKSPHNYCLAVGPSAETGRLVGAASFFFIRDIDLGSNPHVIMEGTNRSTQSIVAWKSKPHEFLRAIYGCTQNRHLLLGIVETIGKSTSEFFVEIDLKTATEIRRMPSVGGQLSPCGRWMTQEVPSESSLHFYSFRDGKTIGLASHKGAHITSFCYSPDGEKIAVCYHDCVMRVFQCCDATPLTELKTSGKPVAGIDWSSDGKTLIAVSSGANLSCYSAETGALTMTFRLPLENPIQVSASKDMHFLTILDGNGELYNIAATP